MKSDDISHQRQKINSPSPKDGPVNGAKHIRTRNRGLVVRRVEPSNIDITARL